MGRPTAASHSYITRLISVFVDELIKLATHFPTVLRDSGELNQLLENTVLPNSSSFLVTADVASLYPNVDAKKALVALDLVLREARASEAPLLIQLARLVFDNNYLSSEFSPDIFLQDFGTAMGTRLGKVSGSDCDLEAILLSFYCRCFAMYVTTTGRNGFPGHQIIDLGQEGLWSLRQRSTAVMPVLRMLSIIFCQIVICVTGKL